MKKKLKNTNLFNYNKWKQTVLTTKASIQDVLKNLNKTGARITMVENSKKEFQGTVSDGDIRRGLINGLQLNSSIKKIVNKNSLTVNASY